jgi:hypothetical protein
MSVEEKYSRLQERRRAAKTAEERHKMAPEIRAMEREAAKAGKILTAVPKAGGKFAVEVKQTSSKRSMQEEYCRKFSDEAQVILKDGEKPITLREHHEKRLLGK